jgi:outer membrane protein TolC
MNIKKFLVTLILLSIVFVSFGQAKKKVTIGTAIDGYWYKNDETFQIFKKEIYDLLGDEYDVDFSKENIILGNWTVPSAKAAIDRLLNDPKIDLVLSLGMLTSNDVCKRTHLPKPVIAPFVMDADVQGMPRKGKGSGVKNLNYLVSLRTVIECLDYFKRIVDFDRVVFMNPIFVRDAFPEAMKWGEKFMEQTGLGMDVIWVEEPYEDVIAQLKPDMQAIFITPIVHIPREELKKIIAAVNRLKIPTFSHMGDTDMEDGVLATINKESDFPRLARRVALNIQRILMGEDAGTLPVQFKTEIRLTINMKTAREIGVYPTWDVEAEAELLHEEEEAGEPLALMDAINRAIKSNLELLSKQTGFRAAKQDIRLAAAKLLPKIDISLTGSKIDGDRAASSFGLFAENTLTGSAALTQVLYSEPALANLSIQKHLQRSREAELDQVTLDIALLASEAYLNVLRAKALERVQEANLEKTRTNLELARVRQDLGVSGPSELYRWEAQYSISQQELLDAKTQREVAEIHLNRVIHHPQGERFKITDAGLASPFLKSRDRRLFDSINNQWIFKVFLEFWVAIGLENAPELNRIDAAIAAKKRYLQSTRYKFYAPTVALRAGVDNYFSKTGKGTESSDMGALGSLFPAKPNDLDWNIGLQLSFNLFSGGEKFVEHKKVKLELEKLETDRKVLVEMLEQNIRTRYRVASTSVTKMDLSRRASEAATKTLEMVTDAYSRGAVSILDLIDAQDAALVADRAEANSLYDFLVNMFRAQRSINRLDFLTKTDEQILMMDKFEAFLAKKGITLRKRKKDEKK